MHELDCITSVATCTVRHQRYKQNIRKSVFNYQTDRHFINKANSV